jgi:hypothetical protein
MDLPVEPRKRVLPEHPAGISTLSAELSEDRRKVRVSVELDRDDTHPDLDLILLDKTGAEVSHSTIIEVPTSEMTFTLHLRKESVEFPITLKCQLSYLNDEVQVHKEFLIT